VCDWPTAAGCDTGCPSANCTVPTTTTPSPCTETDCSNPLIPPGCNSYGGLCTNVADGTLVSYKNDSSKYVQCSKGCGSTLECPSGMYFCSKLQQCTLASQGGCESPCSSPDCSSPLTPGCDSFDGLCKNVTDGTSISYKNDCTKYVQCSKGCGATKQCPTGTHFCSKLQLCTIPSLAGCDPNIKPPCYGSDCVPSGCDTLGGVCKNIADKTLIPFSNDVTKYIQCSKGCGTVFTCPIGTFFCSQLKQCVLPSPCPGTGCSSPSQHGCNSFGGMCKNITQSFSLPSPNDCTKFIQCSNGCGVEKTCPTGTQFSQQFQMCVVSTKDGCDSSTPVVRQSSCSGQEAGKLLPFIGNCSKFIACGEDETAYIMDCGANLHFNATHEICDWPEDAGCDPSYVKPELNPNCQSEGASCLYEDDGKLLPYKGNCDLFVACANGCGYDMKCGKGLHFNKALEICDYPEEAGCESDPASKRSQ